MLRDLVRETFHPTPSHPVAPLTDRHRMPPHSPSTMPGGPGDQVELMKSVKCASTTGIAVVQPGLQLTMGKSLTESGFCSTAQVCSCGRGVAPEEERDAPYTITHRPASDKAKYRVSAVRNGDMGNLTRSSSIREASNTRSFRWNVCLF
jgi:hypothetical protein